MVIWVRARIFLTTKCVECKNQPPHNINNYAEKVLMTQKTIFGQIKVTLTYNVIFDHLLITQKDLLPSQDGGLGPGAKGSWARVDGSRHLLLSGFGDAVDHLISSLAGDSQHVIILYEHETWTETMNPNKVHENKSNLDHDQVTHLQDCEH